MDISHHKFRNGNWEPYNVATEGHVLHDEAPNFDHSQWPTYNNYLPIQNHNETSNSPSKQVLSSPNLLGVQTGSFKGEGDQEDEPDEELGAMKEMMFMIAAMQPVDIDPATIHMPRRPNVRTSDRPQSVAARHRRERIREKIKMLRWLVPGGIKMHTVSLLDEAIWYVKFLERQIRILQPNHHQPPCIGIPTATTPADNWVVAATASATPGTSYLVGRNNSNDDGLQWQMSPSLHTPEIIIDQTYSGKNFKDFPQ